MSGNNTTEASCVLANGKQSKARRARPLPEAVERDLRAKPELHREQIIILRIIEAGISFWQIRRHLFMFEQSETRASETTRMITQLIAVGFAEADGDLVRLTRKGVIAAAAYQ